MQAPPLFVAMHHCLAECTSRFAVCNLAVEDNRDYWREIGWFAPREEDELDGYLFAEDAELRTVRT